MSAQNQYLQNSLVKAQIIEWDPDASNPDPEPDEIEELDSDGNPVEIEDNTKDGTINISSSILYPTTDKSGNS